MREIPKEVIEKSACGDLDAFEEIYKTFSSSVYNIALGITRNREDAEEATQDVFIRIFRAIKNFKFESSFGTWVYRIAVNTAINIYKSRARHRQKSERLTDAAGTAESSPDALKEGIEREDAGSKADELLKVLSPEHRSCIILREVEGLEYKEIADTLNIPVNTVRSRLKRAREALISYCRKEGLRYGM